MVKVREIESSYGFTDGLIEESKRFYDMSIKERDTFLKARAAVNDFIESLEHVPEDVYTYLHIIRDNIGLSTISNNRMNSNLPTETEYIPNSFENTPAELSKYYKKPHTTGGIFTVPHLGLVAESGPEAIIPLSGTNRERGKELWYQAGDSLGMFEEQKETPEPYVQQSRFNILSEEATTQKAVSPISVNLESLGGINVTINGGTDVNNSKAIVAAIRKEMPTIANDLCEQIALMLKKVFDNMPLASS